MNLNNITDDLLVVDYTEYHRKHPDEKLPSDGVTFIDKPDPRLKAFCILNPNHHPYEVINLEENPDIVTDSNGNLVPQSECICSAHREKGKRWIMLVELKYCSENNIPRNMQDALKKLEKCFDFLNEEKHMFDDPPHRVYLCISHPEHDTVKPFGEFIYNQDRLLRLKDRGANLLYCNAVKVLTPEYITKALSPRRFGS